MLFQSKILIGYLYSSLKCNITQKNFKVAQKIFVDSEKIQWGSPNFEVEVLFFIQGRSKVNDI